MARRVTSRTLIGRDEQIAALRSALVTSPTDDARIVLVSGDAGIGKTRLVHDAVRHAREEGLLAAVGGCVQLGEVSIAFAPLVEALREVRAQLDEDVFDDLLGSGRAQLTALLTGDDGATRASGGLFEHLLGFLTRLGTLRPLLLVFEDLHWADPSTRDLVAYLGRNLRHAPNPLVLTLRADEVHRRHPLRPVLAALERDDRIERVDVTGLHPGDVAQLLAEIGVEETDERVIAELHARSGGNPFYVEELVASGRLGGGLPDTLAEVILGRVDVLAERTRQLLRAAAVIDDHVDDELVAAVTDTPIDTVTAALREAVTEQVLVLDTGICRFRHALVREALYDDLLPGERTRLHVATAQALERTDHLPPHTRWAMLAYHWDAARDAEKAYVACLRAGQEAEKVYALADAAERYERALGLRDQVRDPDAVADVSGPELLLLAADALQSTSRSHRVLALCEAALRELDPDAPPEYRARIYERIGRANWTLHHGAAAVRAYEQSATLVADRPPSRDKAYVLAALGQSLMVRALYRQAIPVLRNAIDVAREADAGDVEGHARCSLGPCLLGVGRVDEGFAELARALELTIASGVTEEVSRTYTNLGHACYHSGRYERIDEVARDGIEWVTKVGHARHFGEAIAGNVIATMHCAGRYADAELVHADRRIPNGDPYQELRWLPVLLDTGRIDEAHEVIRQQLENTADADDVQFRALAELLAARLRMTEGDWPEARRLVAAALPLIERTDDQFYRTQAYALGIAIEASSVEDARRDAVAESQAVADDLLRRLHVLTAELDERGSPLLPEPAAWVRTAEAEYARVRGCPDQLLWATAVAAWDDAHCPVPTAAARLRQADALVRTGGDRDAAAELLRQSLATATELGAAPLATDIRSLARRARLDLGTGAVQQDGSAALDVTPRELDVLRLVAQGRTNRQIGETLFISEKTASVHVTNLLRKLGVSSRVEAAAIAVRTGLADDTAAS